MNAYTTLNPNEEYSVKYYSDKDNGAIMACIARHGERIVAQYPKPIKAKSVSSVFDDNFTQPVGNIMKSPLSYTKPKPKPYVLRMVIKGAKRMHENKDDLNVIVNNLNSNPFYKKPNMDLLKEINIKGHLSSETPFIPIEHFKIKDAHLLKGTDTI